MTADLTALSLGAGVQSTTLALLAEEGVIPRPDVAIFADTGWEPASVYAHLDRLEAAVSFPVLRVRNGNLREDHGTGQRAPSLPWFIDTGGEREGISPRMCTESYKLQPIRRKIRELLGATPPDFRRVPGGQVCEQWVGFSTDEVHRANRRKDSDGVLYLTTAYPLLDLGMSRTDCQRWLRVRGWTAVAKSACIGCPFHGNRAWRELRDERPEEWADAVAFDAAIRANPPWNLRGLPYLHRSLLPLAEAPIDRVTRREWSEAQTDLFEAVADAAVDDGEEDEPDGCSPYGCRSGEAVG